MPGGQEVKLPTASSLERGIHCPASFCLPQIRERGGKAANRGTEIHRFLENCHYEGRDAALGKVQAEFQEVCSRIDVQALMPEGTEIHPEAAFGWDWSNGTARCLGFGKERDYTGQLATELVGTLDQFLVWDDVVLCRDFKSGYGYLAPAEKNWQLRFFGLCLHSFYEGKKQVVVEIVKILDTGEFACEPAELSADDHAITAQVLRGMVQDISDAQEVVNQGKTPDVSAGMYCKYCPAWEACPAKGASLQKYLAGQKFTIDALPAAYQLIRDLEQYAKKGLEVIKEAVDEEPLDLGNGMVFGRSPKDGKMREYRR